MNPYVCVVGAVNLDICGRPEKKLIFRDSNPGAVTLTPGGVGRNIAHDLRLLGVEVKFLTAFGGDSHAQLLRNDCVELGMDLSCALDVPGGRTSTYLYITDERGEMQLGLCDTDISAAITPDYLQRHLDVLDGAAAVVLDGNLTAETITWLGAHCSAPLFADPVSVTKAERMRASLGALHTFKPNLTEGQNLTGESTPEGIVAALLAQGVQRVFLSMGSDGILAGTCGELVHLPCLPTCMVNTTGGGDAVMAALVWAYLQGLDLRESAAAALRAGKAYAPKVFAHQIAYNVIPQIGGEQCDGYTSEEMKLQNEGRKILHLPDMNVACTCVRVPVVRSHSISAAVHFVHHISVDKARAAIAAAPGCRLVDDLDALQYPMPLDTSDQDLVFVGRIRPDLTDPNGLCLWCCGEQVRKGAATNCVQIAELLIQNA